MTLVHSFPTSFPRLAEHLQRGCSGRQTQRCCRWKYQQPSDGRGPYPAWSDPHWGHRGTGVTGTSLRDWCGCRGRHDTVPGSLLEGVLSDEFTWNPASFLWSPPRFSCESEGRKPVWRQGERSGAISVVLVVASRTVERGCLYLSAMDAEIEDLFQNHPSWHHRWYGRHHELSLHCDDAACVRVDAAWLIQEKENALLLVVRHEYGVCV